MPSDLPLPPSTSDACSGAASSCPEDATPATQPEGAPAPMPVNGNLVLSLTNLLTLAKSGLLQGMSLAALCRDGQALHGYDTGDCDLFKLQGVHAFVQSALADELRARIAAHAAVAAAKHAAETAPRLITFDVIAAPLRAVPRR